MGKGFGQGEAKETRGGQDTVILFQAVAEDFT